MRQGGKKFPEQQLKLQLKRGLGSGRVHGLFSPGRWIGRRGKVSGSALFPDHDAHKITQGPRFDH